ncbi:MULTISPECIES: preprotein translocase subunit YajC [unclassified Porphyromonas]|uniref:preprotein translocase subunit YajC n=1 Tax=Porphyromonas sp. oral taxon 275 TaxID=712435 RepID=UPI001BA70F0E|nr:preprotein translocase subunit YajC [Porphyromonas sp. oral taxon 275]QUB43584.1 preprotein translocase subunit YajC [Porphyromonas sp. oral taxon 275]
MVMTILQASPQGGGMMNIAMIILIFVIFYFFMIRPQQRKQKELQKKREALGTNDRIVTSGGLYGVIKDIKETEFVVEIADGVRVRVDKGSVFPAGDSSAR